jgi:hypothetical protein
MPLSILPLFEWIKDIEQSSSSHVEDIMQPHT